MVQRHLCASPAVICEESLQVPSPASNKNTFGQIWDGETGKKLVTLKGHNDKVYCCCYAPNGEQIASASCDKTVKVCVIGCHKCAAGTLIHCTLVQICRGKCSSKTGVS